MKEQKNLFKIILSMLSGVTCKALPRAATLYTRPLFPLVARQFQREKDRLVETETASLLDRALNRRTPESAKVLG